MGLPQRGGPDFSVAGFLLLAALGTFIWNSVPLDSARPNGKNKIDQAQSQHRKISAKLWQDPFSALSAHIQIIKAKKPEQTKNNQKRDKNTDEIQNCNLNSITENSIHETGIKNKSIMVIAIMLSPGNEPEKVEKRRRRRYAVVSALGESGFIPEESNTLHYCNLTKKLDGKEIGTSITVPFEWYVPDPLKSQNAPNLPIADKIFVMWVEENYFAERPFGRTKDLAETIAKDWPTKDKLPYIYILGPARSDTLRKLASRAIQEKIDKKFFDGINVSGLHILSATATMVDQLLVPNGFDNNKGYKKIQNLYETFSPNDCNTVKPCVTFQRTINTDDVLARLLVNELKVRNNDQKLTGYIALVSEWDTSFGRALPMTFEREYCKQQIEDKESRGDNTKCEAILRFSYLRGIDGYIPGVTNNTTNKNTTSSRTKKNEQNKNIETKIHRPTGTGQYDYLRRLAQVIQQRNKSLRAEGKGKITAIGILGSDVYDKLLILRVLRPQFPNLIFFTTDLDTQFLHPAEFRWTRNLIIASSFGLALNREIQKETPPFRNSYQTSIFFSTLLAAKYNYPYSTNLLNKVPNFTDLKNYKQLIENQPGLIFEVGRHSAVLLNSSSNSPETSIHQQPVKGSPELTMVLLLFLAVILIMVLHQTKPATGWLIIGTMSALVIVAGIAYTALYVGDYPEPVSFTEGVSVWPTEFIRFGAFSLSVYFLWRMYRDLKNNCSRISRDFFAIKRDPLVSGKTLTDAWEKLKFWEPLKHYIQHPRFLPIWLRDGVLAFVAVNFSLLLSRIFEISNPWVTPVYLLVILVLWFWRINHLKNFKSINGWSLKMRKSQPQFIDDYWEKYCDVGDINNRCYRSLTLYLLYMSFAVMVFQIFGLPEVPCRGVASCNIDILMLMISIPTMLLLIFFVLDELRLSIFWIKGLSKHSMEWRSRKITTYCNTFELHTEAEKKWATMLLIAERTSEISRLIYYPFLIIIIMLLSRNSYFDKWGFPQGLAIVVSINIILLILSGIKLRRVAEAYRFEAIEFLNQKLFHLTALTETETTSGKQDTITQLEIIIRHISELNNGIFQPFHSQALMRASLLLLGAIGLTVGEYATMFN
ncbi:MAG: hypothetical protein ACC657_14455 [Thiohalomonadales bacterium]